MEHEEPVPPIDPLEEGPRGEPTYVVVSVDPTCPDLGNMRMTCYEAVKHYARCIQVLSTENWHLKCECASLRGEDPPTPKTGVPQIP